MASIRLHRQVINRAKSLSVRKYTTKINSTIGVSSFLPYPCPKHLKSYVSLHGMSLKEVLRKLYARGKLSFQGCCRTFKLRLDMDDCTCIHSQFNLEKQITLHGEEDEKMRKRKFLDLLRIKSFFCYF